MDQVHTNTEGRKIRVRNVGKHGQSFPLSSLWLLLSRNCVVVVVTMGGSEQLFKHGTRQPASVPSRPASALDDQASSFHRSVADVSLDLELLASLGL